MAERRTTSKATLKGPPTPALAHGQTVWLTPPGDVVALAQAVRQLAADQELRQKLGAGAAQAARSFSWEEIAAQTAVFFEHVLGRVDIP